MKNFAINTVAAGALTTAALRLVGTAAAAPSGPRALIWLRRNARDATARGGSEGTTDGNAQ
jgi:hypothetical protein